MPKLHLAKPLLIVVIKELKRNKIKPEISNTRKWINRIILLPILLWPLIFFSTVFFFDDPNANPITVWSLFIVVNSYPIYLFLLYKLNSKIYLKWGRIGNLIPLFFLLLLLYGVISQFKSSSEFKEERRKEEENRKSEGYLGQCTTYQLVKDSLFYKGNYFIAEHSNLELINCHYLKNSKFVYHGKNKVEKADPATFEKLNWQWQRDKNHVFHKGVLMDQIDNESFQILEANYSKDKYFVYYYEKIIEGANSNLFEVNPMTHIGNDGKNKYKFGQLANDH